MPENTEENKPNPTGRPNQPLAAAPRTWVAPEHVTCIQEVIPEGRDFDGWEVRFANGDWNHIPAHYQIIIGSPVAPIAVLERPDAAAESEDCRTITLRNAIGEIVDTIKVNKHDIGIPL
jgi:hypothetical protein